MPINTVTIELNACLIVDNNVLSAIAEYCCERLLSGQPAAGKVTFYKKWVGEMLGHLRSHTPDGCLHSSQAVLDEFTPSGAFYAGMHRNEHQGLLAHVRGLLRASPMSDCTPHVPTLKKLPGIPNVLLKNMGKAGGLTDNDLSLAVLGASLTQVHSRVYVLSNDQDLLSFITWFRSQSSAKALWPNLHYLQGYHGLVYLENVHRGCKISTEEMTNIIQHTLTQEYQRSQSVGPEKGINIFQTLMRVNSSLTESALHKQRLSQQVAAGAGQ